MAVSIFHTCGTLGKGIGDVTLAIFLRDMHYCWEKADLKPTLLVQDVMRNLGIEDLKDFAHKNSIEIVQLETALLRFGKNLVYRIAAPVT